MDIALSKHAIDAIRARLEHPFALMFEAVEYRLPILREKAVELFELVPKGEYENVRIYISDLAKVRDLLAGERDKMAYVSFIGEHRDDSMAAVVATDRALIGSTPDECPIIGYVSLQDPNLAWVNLVLFDDLDTLAAWVRATSHADDWAKAARFFSAIEKSTGFIRYVDKRVSLEPLRMTVRDYDAEALREANTCETKSTSVEKNQS